MRINVGFDKKSIQNAIKQIKAVQKKIRTDLPRVYLQKCANWIVSEANNNLSRINMDSKIISLIQSSWVISPVVGNLIKIENTAQYKAGENIAVFVEFGVGVVGEKTSKPQGFIENAISTNDYKYNVRTDNKRASKNPQSKFSSNDNAWRFTQSSDKGIDIQSSYYEEYTHKDGTKKIVTAGSPSQMFLFNAWKSFETFGVYKTLWEQAKKEVIG